MTLTRAKQWADFIIKLGLPFTKASIIRFATNADDEDVWNHYIAANERFLAAAIANHINSADDVESYFREVSYAHMRSTFPKRSHNRSIIGPRIIPLQKLQMPTPKPSNVAVPDETTKEGPLQQIDTPAELIGKRVLHEAEDSTKSFGPGIVTGVDGTRIIISFENAGTKTLSYGLCMSRGYLTFVDEQQK